MYYLIAVRKVEDKKYLFRHTAWIYIFLLYIFMVIQTTGVGTIWDIGNYGEIIRFDEIHLIPFEAGVGIENILNIIMFMPFGFLLPLIWERYRKVWKVVLVGAGFSLAIEMGQLLNRRVSDINDLLMNTFGVLIGYVIWIIFEKIFKCAGKKSIALSANEPIIYLLLSYFGNFLLFNWRFLVKILGLLND